MGPVTSFRYHIRDDFTAARSEARTRAQALLKELEAANRQLSEYAAQVEDLTIANERQRMARELHDTLSQGLAGLILQLEAVDAHLAGNRPKQAGMILPQVHGQGRVTPWRKPARLSMICASRYAAKSERGRPAGDRRLYGMPPGSLCSKRSNFRQIYPELVAETIIRVTISEGLTNIARHARRQRPG